MHQRLTIGRCLRLACRPSALLSPFNHHTLLSSTRGWSLTRRFNSTTSTPSSSITQPLQPLQPSQLSSLPPLHVCIVGSGPSGFYTCESLMEKHPNAHITIFERLPIPFGLIRYGVAPDHPEVKLVQNKFEKLIQDNANTCCFVGNIKVGEDITVEELQQHYHAVVLAYGSANERMLGIPGEGLQGVYSARNFVAWLNGHPDFQKEKFDLERGKTAVVIGQGNVALDVARMLLRSTQELKTTDITNEAIEKLSGSTIEEVHIVGRRGPIQAAFTTKEFREILHLANVAESSMLPNASELESLDRPKKRQVELVMKLKSAPEKVEGKNKRLFFHFFRRPTTFLERGGEENKTLAGITLEKTKLSSEGVDVGTGEKFDLDCGVAFRCIGYKSVKMPGVPFDDAKGVVPNDLGRVVNKDLTSSAPVGLYVAGWLKRGPSGIIATNKWDAEETAQTILSDLKHLHDSQNIKPVLGIDGLQRILSTKGLRPVSFNEWKKIDTEEKKRGKEKGKPLEKITIVSDMLDLIKK